MPNYVLNGYKTPAGVTSRDAVIKEQKRLGVKADGVWGPQTQKAYDAQMRKDNNARMRDVSPAYNSGGGQYEKIPGISDAYFSSDKQYQDYIKNVSIQRKENPPKQAAVKDANKQTNTISDSHYPNNEKNARMRDVSPAYNFGGSQYQKILAISDPAFSGGDQYVAYAEYLKDLNQTNIKPKVNTGLTVGGFRLAEKKREKEAAISEIMEKIKAHPVYYELPGDEKSPYENVSPTPPKYTMNDYTLTEQEKELKRDIEKWAERVLMNAIPGTIGTVVNNIGMQVSINKTVKKMYKDLKRTGKVSKETYEATLKELNSQILSQAMSALGKSIGSGLPYGEYIGSTVGGIAGDYLAEQINNADPNYEPASWGYWDKHSLND